MSSLIDRYGRYHTYLRVSLTDRCNFQCRYCLPPEGLPETPPPASHCTDDEFCQMIEAFVALGIRKIRLSGGEPLLRKGVPALVAKIRQRFSLPIFMTTNGSLLKRYLPALKEAGLNGINLSLDTLNRERFNQVTQTQSYERVVEAARLTASSGISLKINAVVQADYTTEEAIDLIEFGRELQVQEVRFIEFMPLCGSAWVNKGVGRIVQLEEELIDYFQLKNFQQGEVAHTYEQSDHSCQVGFISSLSKPFCGTCNRVRLSCTGVLHPCLFSRSGSDLLTPLRQGASPEEMKKIILGNVWQKTKAHGTDEEIHFETLTNPLQVTGLIHQIGG